MKHIFVLSLIVLFTLSSPAQTPQKMSYQAVIRNSSNALVITSPVGIRISILQGSSSGQAVYIETQTPTTNSNGLVSLEIGGGTPVAGTFSAIIWSAGPYFVKTETDPAGGTTYTITGTSEILSVPFALFAKEAENGFSGSYPDLTNKPVIFDGQYGSLTGSPAVVSAFTNDAGYLTSLTETDPMIGTNTTGFSPKWNGSALVTGAVYQDATGNVGIGTTNPVNKLQVQNGNLVIDRSVSTSVLSLGTVAGVTGRIFAGDAGGGSLNTNYNQIKLTANPANTEELLRLHTGANAATNTGTAAIFFGQFNLTDMAAIKAVNEGGQPLNRTAGLSFWTEPAGTGVPLIERMRIAGNGNIGIGLTTPATKLDVSGVITAIEGNSTNWNTAYGWGDHAGLYRPVGYVPSWIEITDKPSTLNGFGITDAVNTTGDQTIAGNKFFTGTINAGGSVINNVASPVSNNDAANKAYVDSKTSSHYVGESYGGGIVFYVYDNGQHGLIAAIADATVNGTSGLKWIYNSGTARTAGAGSNGIGAGKTNTSAMLAMQYTLTPAASSLSTLSAAVAAAKYSASDAQGVQYGDWYLPSSNEMILATQSGVVPNLASWYWSSTEASDNSNYAFAIYGGSITVQGKDGSFNVRAVRSF